MKRPYIPAGCDQQSRVQAGQRAQAAYAGMHYRMPIARRVRRFFSSLWRFITAPHCDL